MQPHRQPRSKLIKLASTFIQDMRLINVCATIYSKSVLRDALRARYTLPKNHQWYDVYVLLSVLIVCFTFPES